MIAEARGIERFHLATLLHLQTRLPIDLWTVKGGMNVRAFFGSPRVSKDLDIDADAPPDQGERRVTDLLASAGLRSELARGEITLVDSHPGKATRTTLRWKPELAVPGRS